MIQTILIFAVFAFVIYLMMRGKMTLFVGLPLIAISTALIAGVPLLGDESVVKTICTNGVIKMAGSYACLIISAWLGAMMNLTGISKTIIKTAAELGGDKPLLVTILLTIATSLCYTTINGLGGVIMLAQIAVPIMLSVGVPGIVAIGVFLFSYAIGLELNMANWTYFSSLTGVAITDVQLFAWTLCGLTSVMCLVFILTQFKKEGVKYAWPVEEEPEEFKKAPALSCLTPLIPILLVVIFKWDINGGLFAGMLYCFITTVLLNKDINVQKMLDLTTRASIEGYQGCAQGVLSMICVGMLTSAIDCQQVMDTISGVLTYIVPKSQIVYILFFAILAPLALYRGPLNIWGIGAGLATVITTMGVLPANAVMCGFIGCERMQVICDPTNSHNIWLSNYVGTDTNTLLKRLFPYVWALCAIAAVVSGFMWF